MARPATVVVYNFRVPDGGPAIMSLAPFKATREAIERVYGGEALEGTAQEIDVEELDSKGRFRRLATGWGDLG